MNEADKFFDTNILLYLLSSDSAKADRAEALLAAGGIISVQVLNEFASVAFRKLAMDVADIQAILSTVRTVCAVKSLDVETHELGLDLAGRYRFSIFDSMIIAAALRAECTILFTEDLQHGQVIDQLARFKIRLLPTGEVVLLSDQILRVDMRWKLAHRE